MLDSGLGVLNSKRQAIVGHGPTCFTMANKVETNNGHPVVSKKLCKFIVFDGTS